MDKPKGMAITTLSKGNVIMGIMTPIHMGMKLESILDMKILMGIMVMRTIGRHTNIVTHMLTPIITTILVVAKGGDLIHGIIKSSSIKLL